MSDHTYVGTELDLFAKAVNWKRYYASSISPSIRGDVLEVGAGIGGTTRVLHSSQARSWTCLEPDPALAGPLSEMVAVIPGGVRPKVAVGCVADLDADARFDCILYIDVLEHIAEDSAEMEAAASRLRPGGCIVVLSPAHQFLFSEFDRQIGHHRRYNKRSLRALRPADLREESCYYLDSLGTLLSLANRMLLRSGSPSEPQILLWDRRVIPISRLVDPLLGFRLGKSVVIVWRKPA